MKITYSTAAERVERAGRAKPSRAVERVGLLLASLVTILGLALVYQAKVRRDPGIDEALAAGRVVHLNRVEGVEGLLPLLGRVGETETERRYVATRLAAYLGASDAAGSGGRRRIDSVSALGGVTVGSGDITANARLVGLRQRLAAQRERLGNPKEAIRIPLVSSTDLAAMRPSAIVRTPGSFRVLLLAAAGLLLAGFYLAHAFLSLRRSSADTLLLPIVHLLCGLGLVAMVTLRDPLRDAPLFLRFAQGTAAGCVVLAAVTLMDFQRSALRKLSYVPLAGAIAVSVVLVVFGSGPGTSDAKVNLLGAQPVEAIRLLVVLFLAGYFANRWEFLRALREPAAGRGARLARWFDVPRLDYVVPVFAGMGLVLVFFFLQKDLGPALVLSCVFLALYAVARSRAPMVLVGLALLMAGFWAGYLLGFPRTVVQRVGMWGSPWENGLRGGDQVAQALWALASGGLAGTGLGLGEPRTVPAGHTDLVLAALGEELGFVGVAVIFTLYAALGVRALGIARRSRGDYSFFLALGLTLSLVLQLFLIAGGQTGVMPLTGVVTPFLSYGRSSMLANFAAIGMLLAISQRGEPRGRNRDFDRPLRWVVVVSGVLLATVLGRIAFATVLRPEQTAAAAVLTMQADGVRRYQYNPRLLAAARQVPRGTIFDRNGLPLATSRSGDLATDKAELAQLGAAGLEACRAEGMDAAPAGAARRCYPFGGVTFHLLGDWRTRLNWGARNTSFEEREGDARLRGYDDHAQIVEVRGARAGTVDRVIRRSYRDLLPLWWYRYRRGHPDVARILSRERDVRMSLDMRLQARVASALDARIKAANKARGAAVVLSADGDLLSAVSYPWPDLGEEATGDDPDVVQDATDEALLDRARYGVYAPGSSFKVVTATAALRKDSSLERQKFVCERLPDGRVGQRIKGWGRPVRDDPTDKSPHGVLDLSSALIVSCNAYFAQLGLAVGGAALAETARLFEIPLVQSESPAAIRDTLPFASYGQGQVLVTPFKMARVAATIAADGMMPYGRWVSDDTNARVEPPRAVLSPTQAKVLARAMREVVLNGTGRAVRGIEPAIAGKTGTAEVQDRPSHSWFIGFAPYAAAPKDRIAFAVIVEHGGYGASVAAPIAGDIVTAARELGIVK